MKKAKFFLLLLFSLLFFSTYLPNQNNISRSFLFPIDSIKIENTKIVKPNNLKKKLEFLKGKSLSCVTMLENKELCKFFFVIQIVNDCKN